MRVDVKNFSLRAQYQRFPYPLEVSGNFLYDDASKRVELENASGSAGGSSFSRLSGSVTVDEQPALQITSGACSLLMEQLYPWLSSVESLKSSLKRVESVKGVVKLESLRMKGVVTDAPDTWQFQAAGAVQDVVVFAPDLEVPFTLSSGAFNAGPEQLSLSSVSARFRDSSIKMSGTLEHYIRGLDRADLTLEGDIGAESHLRLSDVVDIPPELRIRSPLSFKGIHLLWEKDGTTALSGNVQVQHGPAIVVDAFSRDDELTIKRFVMRDEKSDASLSFHLKGSVLDLSFDGSLFGTTLDAFFEKNEFLTGWMKGSLSAHVDLDQPFNSTARGRLEGAGLEYPHLREMVQLETVAVDAQGSLFTIDSRFAALGHSATLKGKVDFVRDGFVFDLDAAAGAVDLDRVLGRLTGTKKGASSFWKNPLRGTLRLQADHVTYRNFSWQPVYTNIIFARDRVSIGVMQANLCTIDTLGILDVTPGGFEVRVQPLATNRDLHEALVCLTGKTEVSGRYTLGGDVSGKGTEETLLQSLRGAVDFEAKNGRVDRYGLIAKIFEVLSPTGLFRISDLRKEGFAYNTIKANSTLQDSKVVIRQALIDAPFANLVFNGEITLLDRSIDAVVLVIPFRTIDRVISYIPLVNYVMAGRLVAIPVRIKGTLENPDVTPFSPSAVGAGLLDTVKRFFNLPLEIIQPLRSDEEREKKKETP